MYLEGKNFVAPNRGATALTKTIKTAIKSRIKELCPIDGRKSYEELVKVVQDEFKVQDKHLTNDEIISVIDEVKGEADYTKPVVAEVVEKA